MTLEVVDKSAKEIIEYIDEELLKRIKAGLCHCFKAVILHTVH